MAVSSCGNWVRFDGFNESLYMETDELARLAGRALNYQESVDAERVEEEAKALGAALSRYAADWDNLLESTRERYRAAIRAGWGKADKSKKGRSL